MATEIREFDKFEVVAMDTDGTWKPISDIPLWKLQGPVYWRRLPQPDIVRPDDVIEDAAPVC